MSEKIIEGGGFHILVDMDAPRVFVSFNGNNHNVTSYMNSAKSRGIALRHIRIDELGIKMANNDGDLVQ